MEYGSEQGSRDGRSGTDADAEQRTTWDAGFSLDTSASRTKADEGPIKFRPKRTEADEGRTLHVCLQDAFGRRTVKIFKKIRRRRIKSVQRALVQNYSEKFQNNGGPWYGGV